MTIKKTSNIIFKENIINDFEAICEIEINNNVKGSITLYYVNDIIEYHLSKELSHFNTLISSNNIFDIINEYNALLVNKKIEKTLDFKNKYLNSWLFSENIENIEKNTGVKLNITPFDDIKNDKIFDEYKLSIVMKYNDHENFIKLNSKKFKNGQNKYFILLSNEVKLSDSIENLVKLYKENIDDITNIQDNMRIDYEKELEDFKNKCNKIIKLLSSVNNASLIKNEYDFFLKIQKNNRLFNVNEVNGIYSISLNNLSEEEFIKILNILN